MNQDFALTGNDLLVKDGDFAISESDIQHIADTMNAFPGWWKEHPADGIGIFAYYNGPVNTQQLKKNITLQLTSDGYRVTNPEVLLNTDGQLVINPNAVPNENV